MEKSQNIDPKQKTRIEFRYPSNKSTTAMMEEYAHKLRKDKRENTIAVRRAKALEQMAVNREASEAKNEMRILVEFMQQESALMEESSYPVLLDCDATILGWRSENYSKQSE